MNVARYAALARPLAELDTALGAQDLYDLLEIMAVDAYNSRTED